MAHKTIAKNHNGIYQLLDIGPASAWNHREDKETYVGMYFTAKEIIKFPDGFIYANGIKWLADPKIHGTEYIPDFGYAMFDIKIRKVRL